MANGMHTQMINPAKVFKYSFIFVVLKSSTCRLIWCFHPTMCCIQFPAIRELDWLHDNNKGYYTYYSPFQSICFYLNFSEMVGRRSLVINMCSILLHVVGISWVPIFTCWPWPVKVSTILFSIYYLLIISSFVVISPKQPHTWDK